MQPDNTNTAEPDMLNYSLYQHQGSRENQEDYILCERLTAADDGDNQSVLGVLADGMGGLAGGEIASKVVAIAFARALKSAVKSTDEDAETPDNIMISALQQANEALRQRKLVEPQELSSMGSTLCAAWIQEDKLYYLSVGDSLIYLMRGTRLYRLNQLHNFREDARRNALSKGENWEILSQSPEVIRFGSRITSYVGGGQIAQADCPAGPVQLEIGDIILLSSDGLLTLSSREIAGILKNNAIHLTADDSGIAETLVSATIAKQARRQDNVSVVIIRYNPSV